MGGHSPVPEVGLNWGLETWGEWSLLDRVPSQKMPRHTCATSVEC